MMFKNRDQGRKCVEDFIGEKFFDHIENRTKFSVSKTLKDLIVDLMERAYEAGNISGYNEGYSRSKFEDQ